MAKPRRIGNSLDYFWSLLPLNLFGDQIFLKLFDCGKCGRLDYVAMGHLPGLVGSDEIHGEATPLTRRVSWVAGGFQ
jgi:hypothetical protein